MALMNMLTGILGGLQARGNGCSYHRKTAARVAAEHFPGIDRRTAVAPDEVIEDN